MTLTKSRTILWLLIPAAFVVAFLWDIEKPTPQFVEVSTNPDYYLTATSTTEFDTAGQSFRTYSSEKMSHFIEAQRTELEQAIFQISADSSQQTWRLSADTARNNALSEELLLEGSVLLTNLPQDKADNNQMYLRMSKLLIDLSSMVAETQDDVTLETQHFLHTATGMSADFINNTVEFTSNVETQER